MTSGVLERKVKDFKLERRLFMSELRTNKDKLVQMSMQSSVSPADRSATFCVGADGIPFFLPGTGGICYNVLVGDNTFGWEADHVEPGVSTRADKDASNSRNAAYNFLACIGNKVKIVSGEAKGEFGFVTGKHGGSERVMVDFSKETLEVLIHDDKMMIKTFGQGLKLLDYSDIVISNIDPDLLNFIVKDKDGQLHVGVTHVIPGKIMGSGIGTTKIGSGDYDITTHDPKMIKRYNLDTIRFGDIVAIKNHDCRFGREYKTGAISIGIIVHSDCKFAGHGPGVTVFMTTIKNNIINLYENKDANIAKIIGLGIYR